MIAVYIICAIITLLSVNTLIPEIRNDTRQMRPGIELYLEKGKWQIQWQGMTTPEVEERLASALEAVREKLRQERKPRLTRVK